MPKASQLNRSQVLVLGFFVAVVVSLAAILIVAPDVYGNTFKIGRFGSRLVEAGFLAALLALVAFLALGVVRRWRWTFWLIVAAFVAGVLRVPATILQLAGIVPLAGPTWYVLVQGAIGVVQFLIGLALLRGYRKGGLWGPF